jgi:uncharacterized membrane protein YhaH (DUF805 family)
VSARPPLERWLAHAFGDAEATRFGSGWISGTASVFLGAVALFGAVAFRSPGALSSAAFRAHYPIPLLRALLEVTIGLAFLLGALSLVLRRRKALGLTGIGLALAATLAGGGSVPIESTFDQPVTIGLDWFLLNLFLLTLVFVPLERRLPPPAAADDVPRRLDHRRRALHGEPPRGAGVRSRIGRRAEHRAARLLARPCYTTGGNRPPHRSTTRRTACRS